MNRDRLGHYLLKLGPMSKKADNAIRIILGILAVWVVYRVLDGALVFDECSGAFSGGIIIGGFGGMYLASR